MYTLQNHNINIGIMIYWQQVYRLVWSFISQLNDQWPVNHFGKLQPAVVFNTKPVNNFVVQFNVGYLLINKWARPFNRLSIIADLKSVLMHLRLLNERSVVAVVMRLVPNILNIPSNMTNDGHRQLQLARLPQRYQLFSG